MQRGDSEQFGKLLTVPSLVVTEVTGTYLEAVRLLRRWPTQAITPNPPNRTAR